ncbi:hypothetical protein BLA13014_07716 [Burkholderia aenigmatica]|uniref:Uncharacterized protein n=1 Tax=Burkholderia aenigmatica TaxID=2015348 RepID=A0A6P2SWT0_9BURK|nr:hypothetical protein BLA13014_07716 [Burkholderia aenigmatica]
MARANVAAEAASEWLPAGLAAIALATGAAANETANRDGRHVRATTNGAVAAQARARPLRHEAEPVVAKRMPLPCFICLAFLDAGRHAACQYASRRANSASRCAGSMNDASKPLRITAWTSASVSCSPSAVAK